MISGVPTNPVLIRKPDARTRSARRSPAWWRWSAVGSRAQASARAYTVGASLSTRPPGVTNSRAKASRTSPARRVLLGHVGVAGHGRGQAHDAAGQVGRGHHVRVGLGLERGVMGSGRVQPVAELEATGPQAVDAGQPGDVVDPGAHARQLPASSPTSPVRW